MSHGALVVAASLASVINVVPANAQGLPDPPKPLSFSVVASGSTASSSGEKVIESASDYKDFLGLDAPAGINFGTKAGDDVVLAIARTGWFASSTIQVTDIEISTTLDPASITTARVSYATTGGPIHPGTLPATANPFVAVKVARPLDNFTAFIFEESTSAPKATFSELKLEVGNTSAMKTVFTLKSDGSCTHEFFCLTCTPAPGSIPMIPQPTSGQATKAELDAITKDFAAADVTTLPANVPLSAMLLGAKHIELDSTVDGKTFTFGAFLQWLGPIGARAKPLIDDLMALDARIAKAPAPASNEIDITGVASKDGTDTIITEGFGGGPISFPPIVQNRPKYVVTNDPFKSLIGNAAGKAVTVHARTLETLVANPKGTEIEVLSVTAQNPQDKNVPVRDAKGKLVHDANHKLVTMGPNATVTITGETGNKLAIDLGGANAGKTFFVDKKFLDVGFHFAVPLSEGINGALGHAEH
jgi:hypothetical protein